MPLAGYEPAISASELPQTDALDRAATGIGTFAIDTVPVKNTVDCYYQQPLCTSQPSKVYHQRLLQLACAWQHRT